MLARKLERRDVSAEPLHDFRNFLYVCFTEVFDLGQPHQLQYAMAARMQDMALSPGGITRKQIQALRGAGKTVIVCCFCVWLWYLNATIRIAVISSTEKRASEMAMLVKQILDALELVANLRPDPESNVTYRRGKRIKNMAQDRNSSDRFDVRGAGPGKDPSFAAYPVFGGWTGAHPDIIIPDDTEIPENSMTALKRERLFEKLRECESLVMEGGMVMYMGTPQTEESIYSKLEDQGYPIFRFPAEVPDPSDADAMRNVDPYILELIAGGAKPGEPVYPERFPRARLIEKRAMGVAYYNLQYLLDTTLSDQERYPLKLRNLIVFDTANDMAPSNIVWGTANVLKDLDPPGFTGDHLHGPGYSEERWVPYQGTAMYIDPKGGGADSVGWAVGGFCNGVIYVMDAGGMAPKEDGTSDKVMKELAQIAASYGIQQIIVESNWGGSKEVSTYAKLLGPHVAKACGPVSITTNHVSGQKERRIIDCLEPVLASHRLVLSRAACECTKLLYQITHITRDAGSLVHDDELDALYGLVSHFAENLNLDPEVRENTQRQRDADELYREWDQWTSQHGAISSVEKATAQPNPSRWPKQRKDSSWGKL